MTRSDYLRLAEALRSTKPERDLYSAGDEFVNAQWERCCESIADCIAQGNPKFDRELFMRNCGVIV